jgi:hypothetical protein
MNFKETIQQLKERKMLLRRKAKQATEVKERMFYKGMADGYMEAIDLIEHFVAFRKSLIK